MVNIEVSEHFTSVDTGIGAAGADYGRRASKRTRQRLFDCLLDGDVSRLVLPSMEMRSVVAQSQKISH